MMGTCGPRNPQTAFCGQVVGTREPVREASSSPEPLGLQSLLAAAAGEGRSVLRARLLAWWPALSTPLQGPGWGQGNWDGLNILVWHISLGSWGEMPDCWSRQHRHCLSGWGGP